MVDIQRQKEEDRLWRNFWQFTIAMVLATIVLFIVHRYIPAGIVTIPWLIRIYPLVYSFSWGIIMGALLLYGARMIGSPIHHIFKQILPTGSVPLSANISDMAIIALSLLFADQFKRILEKISNTNVTASLAEQLIGFIIGRTIVILMALWWIRGKEEDIYYESR